MRMLPYSTHGRKWKWTTYLYKIKLLIKIYVLIQVRKRLNNKNVKQWNSIRFTEEFEEWIPRENESQLEALKVARKIPFIAVLITAQDCSLTTPPNSWTRQVELQSFLNVNGNRTSNKVSQQSNRKKTPRKKLAPVNP